MIAGIQMWNYVRRIEDCSRNFTSKHYAPSILPNLQQDNRMNHKKSWIIKLAKTITIVTALLLGIPISISQALGIPLSKTLSLIASTFALEYFAAAVGAGLGLNPAFILLVTTCVALSVVLLLLTIFDIVGEKSKKISNFLLKARKKAQKTKILQKYGVYGLVFAVPLLGFYICPAIAWTLGWRRSLAVSMITVGFALASSIVLLVSTGILKIQIL